jgi:atypical dual specificity phosphatase
MTGGGVLNALILTVLWSIWTIFLTAPFYLLVGKYVVLSIYLPLALVMAHKPAGHTSWLFLAMETLLWDKPLILWANMISMLGSRALPPFMNIIREGAAAKTGDSGRSSKYNRGKGEEEKDGDDGDFLIVGSMPLARDVAETMSQAPYNVGCVVNLCREYVGPEREYIKSGITQMHLPTPDMCEPQFATVIDAVSFLRLFRGSKKNAGKRALIHCKGGRGRSACIAICYLLSTGKYSLKEAFRTVKASRLLADARVKRYKVVERFARGMEQCEGSFERLQLRLIKDNPDLTGSSSSSSSSSYSGGDRGGGRGSNSVRTSPRIAARAIGRTHSSNE